MQWQILGIFIVTAFLFQQLDAKKFMRCEMVKELVQKYKFDKTFLSNWVCMIEHESNRDTSKVTAEANGSARYGLFQISSKEWCKQGRKGGICNVKCEDLIDENLTDDVNCAKKVYARDGFKHWAGWNRVCRKPNSLLDLNLTCKLNNLRRR